MLARHWPSSRGRKGAAMCTKRRHIVLFKQFVIVSTAKAL